MSMTVLTLFVEHACRQVRTWSQVLRDNAVCLDLLEQPGAPSSDTTCEAHFFNPLALQECSEVLVICHV